MKHTQQKRMTLDGLARGIQRQYLDVHGEIRELRDVVDDIHIQNRKILESNDKLVTRFDALLKEEAAHTILHKRTDDRLEHHEKRLTRLEARN